MDYELLNDTLHLLQAYCVTLTVITFLGFLVGTYYFFLHLFKQDMEEKKRIERKGYEKGLADGKLRNKD